jgi:preprotein translocase subunit SecF
MSRLGAIGGRLYRGEVSFDFVGRKKLWYAISGLILVISIFALAFRGLNYSVDFKGGDLFIFKASGTTNTQISTVVKDAGGGDDSIVTQLGLGSKARWQVQTDKLGFAQQTNVQDALASKLHVPGGPNAVSISFTSATWGSQITHKALEGLIVFLVLIVAYLTIAFEWRMAVAAFVALIHDIVITTGVYALAGFQVSPATVIGLLTILGYSLYDTVVVFDKVRENTAGLLATGRSTYSQAANLALNQTLVRSINTSLIALLPVTAILVTAVTLLGTGELQDLALVLFVGMLSGTYSSIFIATPVLASLKERQPKFKDLARRVALRESGGRAAQRRAQAEAAKAAKAAKAPAGRGAAGAAGRGPGTAVPGPGPATALGATATGPAAAGPDSAAALDDGYDQDDYDQDDYDQEAAANGDAADVVPGERIPAGRAASGSVPRGASGGRPGPRQQPKRSSAAKRRPTGKKKRR